MHIPVHVYCISHRILVSFIALQCPCTSSSQLSSQSKVTISLDSGLYSAHTHTHTLLVAVIINEYQIFFPLLGPREDYKLAREFIARMFIEINDERSADIYPHFTCATDTDNIKFVFDVVKSHILQQHIIEVIPGL